MKNLTLQEMEKNLRSWLDSIDESLMDYDLFIEKKSSKNLYDTFIIVYIYTNTNKYDITASIKKGGVGYLCCKSFSRKCRTGEEKYYGEGNSVYSGDFSKQTWNKIIQNIISYESVRIQKYNFENSADYRGAFCHFFELDLNPIFYYFGIRKDKKKINSSQVQNSMLHILWLDLKYILKYIVAKKIKPFYNNIPSDIRFDILACEIDHDFFQDKNFYDYDNFLDFLFDEIFVELAKNKQNIEKFKEWLSSLKSTIEYHGILLEVYKRYLEQYDKQAYNDFIKKQGGLKRRELGRKLLEEGVITEQAFLDKF